MKVYFEPVGRREFLKKTAKGGAVIATVPLWNLFSCALPPSDVATSPPVDIDVETLNRLLSIALQNGGDFAEVYVEYNVTNNIDLDESKIRAASRGVDMGVGIRVLEGERTGYAHTDDLSPEKLEETARIAGLIASEEAKQQSFSLKEGDTLPDYYLVETSPDNIVPQDKAKLLWKADSVARAYDKRITQVGVSFNDINKKIIIANTEGTYVTDNQTISRLMVRTSAFENGKRSRAYAYKGGTLGYENYDPQLAEELAKEAGQVAITMLPAEDAPAGEYPIVLAKGDCGTFFHEAIGHSLEGDGARRKTTCFWDRQGKTIASKIVSLADDGTVPGARGSINVDDEGTPSQNTVLIENGVCTGFLYDKLNSKLMSTRSTGNGRRESYQHYPIPRMTNTYLMAGEDDPEESN
jgi:TldD protein